MQAAVAWTAEQVKSTSAEKRGEAPAWTERQVRSTPAEKRGEAPPWEHIYYGENANPIDLMSALAYNIGKTGLKSEPWFVFVGGVG